MAFSKLIAAILVALSAIVLEAAAGESLEKDSRDLWIYIRDKLPLNLKGNSEEEYSFAENYSKNLKGTDAQTTAKLMTAWDRVLHQPARCDKLSLKYIATISRCNEDPFDKPPKTLIEATQKYARKCLKPEYIEDKIKSRTSSCFLNGCFKTEVEFIDDQFITDYWSEQTGERNLTNISGLKCSKAMAKAIIRDRKNNIENLNVRDHVHDYLDERLYKPCSKYWKALKEVMGQISFASRFLEGGYDKLIPLLNDKTKKALFRYHLCERREIRYELWHQPETFEIAEQVVSDLKSMASS